MNRTNTRYTVVCAPDKWRGALTSFDAAAAMGRGVEHAGGNAICVGLADGGEGTLDVLCRSGYAEPVAVAARDASGNSMRALVGRVSAGHFIVEAATVLAADAHSDAGGTPLDLSSAGLGDLILACLDLGAKEIEVAIGGVATMDGGLGMLAALGADVPGENGHALFAPRPFDLTAARRALGKVKLRVLYDVASPLCGLAGAAFMFGEQKGLPQESLASVDRALRKHGELLRVEASAPGAGSAGGIGAALYALGATGLAGADVVLDVLGLPDQLCGASLCLTGEGRLDRTTAHGKAVAAVVAASKRARVPCTVIAGVVEPDAKIVLEGAGASKVIAISVPGRRPLEEALRLAPTELEEVARLACLEDFKRMDAWRSSRRHSRPYSATASEKVRN